MELEKDVDGNLNRVWFTNGAGTYFGHIPINAVAGINTLPLSSSADEEKLKSRISRTIVGLNAIGSELADEIKRDEKIRQCVLLFAKRNLCDRRRSFRQCWVLPEEPILSCFHSGIDPHFPQAQLATDSTYFQSTDYLDVAGCGWVYTVGFNLLDSKPELVVKFPEMKGSVVFFDVDKNSARISQIALLLSSMGMRCYLVTDLPQKVSIGTKGLSAEDFIPVPANYPQSDSAETSLWQRAINFLRKTESLAGVGIPHRYISDSDRVDAVDSITSDFGDNLTAGELEAQLSRGILREIQGESIHFLLPLGELGIDIQGQNLADQKSYMLVTINPKLLRNRSFYFVGAAAFLLILAGLTFTLTFRLQARIARNLEAAKSQFLQEAKLGFLMIDNDNRIRFENDAAFQMISTGKLAGRDFSEFVLPEYIEVYNELIKAKENGEYWPPCIIGVRDELLRRDYALKSGCRLCLIGGPIELLEPNEVRNSKVKRGNAVKLGMVLTLNNAIDLVEARRITLLCTDGGYFENHFDHICQENNKPDRQRGLIFTRAHFNGERLSVSAETREEILKSAQIIIGCEPGRHQPGLPDCPYITELGVALAGKKVVYIISLSDAARDITDVGILKTSYDPDTDGPFDDWFRNTLLDDLQARSVDFTEDYWRKLNHRPSE